MSPRDPPGPAGAKYRLEVLASQLLFNPLYGETVNEELIERAWPRARRPAQALEDLLVDRNSSAPDLADIQLAPTLRYFFEIPEGAAIVAGLPRLSAWWAWMEGQPPVQEIVPPTRWDRLL